MKLKELLFSKANLALALLLSELPGVRNILDDWRHPIAIIGGVLFVMARLMPYLRRIYVAILDLDNPKAGMARELAVTRQELKSLAEGNAKTLAIANQLLFTHREGKTIDDLVGQMDQRFGALEQLINLARNDVNTVGKHVKSVDGRVEKLEEWAKKADGRIDNLERKVGT